MKDIRINGVKSEKFIEFLKKICEDLNVPDAKFIIAEYLKKYS